MSDEQWVENLNIALSFGVPHISSYALTVEPKTALKKLIELGKIPKVSESDSHRQYLILLDKIRFNLDLSVISNSSPVFGFLPIRDLCTTRSNEEDSGYALGLS